LFLTSAITSREDLLGKIKKRSQFRFEVLALRWAELSKSAALKCIGEESRYSSTFFSISALDGDELLASRPGRLAPGKSSPLPIKQGMIGPKSVGPVTAQL
jgi:hypothetical protein